VYFLKENLKDWTDIDGAAHSLSISLGLAPSDSEMREFKSIYWSNNDLGNHLNKILDTLVETGFLLKRDEPDFQYKWNNTYEIFYKID